VLLAPMCRSRGASRYALLAVVGGQVADRHAVEPLAMGALDRLVLGLALARLLGLRACLFLPASPGEKLKGVLVVLSHGGDARRELAECGAGASAVDLAPGPPGEAVDAVALPSSGTATTRPAASTTR
jgi:hypothetical protein